MSPSELLADIDRRLKNLEILFDRDDFDERLEALETRMDEAEGMLDFVEDELTEIESRLQDYEGQSEKFETRLDSLSDYVYADPNTGG